jgi:hypothetical protein
MLPDQLIESFFRHGAIAIRVSINPMVRTGGFAVDRNLDKGLVFQLLIGPEPDEGHGNEIDKRWRLKKRVRWESGARPPNYRQAPLIQFEVGGRLLDLRLVLIEATRRGEVFGPAIANVGLRRLNII